MEGIVPGIGVGGMTDKYEIKILICYLLHAVKTPLSKEHLTLIFSEGELVNYFSFCDAFNELLSSNHLKPLEEEGETRYSLNPLGVETAERLERSLPRSLRDNVVSAAMRLIARLRIERDNKVEIRPHEKGFLVSCVSRDGEFLIMRLELYAPDLLQAQRIRDRFLEDPSQIYQKLVESLIESD